MIIEVTGATGSGKTEFVKILEEKLSLLGQSTSIVGITTGYTINIPEYFASVERHNWKTDLLVFPGACLLFLAHPKYTRFLFSNLLNISSHKVAVLRSIIRKVGIYYFLSRKNFKNKLVVVDEGILHVGHNLLVDTREEFSQTLLKDFALLSPVADITIVLSAPPSVIEGRLKIRGDWSPRVQSMSELRKFCRNAVFLYETIRKSLMHKTELIYVDTSEGIGDASFDQLVEKIMGIIKREV